MFLNVRKNIYAAHFLPSEFCVLLDASNLKGEEVLDALQIALPVIPVHESAEKDEDLAPAR